LESVILLKMIVQMKHVVKIRLMRRKGWSHIRHFSMPILEPQKVAMSKVMDLTPRREKVSVGRKEKEKERCVDKLVEST